MQEMVRFLFLLLITLLVLFSKSLVLSLEQNLHQMILFLGLVQCRTVFTETMGRHKRSLNNFNYMNLCAFRKSRLCDCKF
jgi:hypothetical protein